MYQSIAHIHDTDISSYISQQTPCCRGIISTSRPPQTPVTFNYVVFIFILKWSQLLVLSYDSITLLFNMIPMFVYVSLPLHIHIQHFIKIIGV